jgi:NAD(P)-dependent dehydrogenase (short-subunit alcohol dehydrogenase family)
MSKRLEGKVIAVAGGTGGIGSAVSKRLAEEGALVIIGDIDSDSADRVAGNIKNAGGRAVPLRLDIADEPSVLSFVRSIVDSHGGIDGFHVNAVDSSRSDRDTDPVGIDMGDYDYMMRVNMRGYFLCTRHAVPELIKRGGGCILYTSSGAAHAGMPVKPVYAMLKSGIHALARHVASRFGKEGVRSNAIAPGLMVHARVEEVLTPAQLAATLESVAVPRLGRPEDIAAMAALLLSDDGAYITGQVISVDGGASMRP